MTKLKRNERIAAMVKILGDHPNHIFTLNYFTEKFNAAKSTISEDIVVVKGAMEKMDLGKIKTISGAAGGVKYIPITGAKKSQQILQNICEKMNSSHRILPGGFLYMTDIIYHPQTIHNLGELFATQFNYENVDAIITVETKGIPLALMVAKAMNLPLVILRRDNKVTEGSTVSINYISGSSDKISRMSLSRRALKPGARVIIIDDFMKAGGTAKGMIDMMKEFEVEVEGIGVLIATKEPRKKLVDEYVPLLILEDIGESQGKIDVVPNPIIIE
ncbi:purine operon repressor, PurR [Alkaliphilus metalliredigens QYMF]|uniref:Purine operon repressor, PurR n=1 Tax=Alkaliphilus metalliredigens (strain QYMF) TaxID=293826 RepID=A6TJM3_ALKMQ|nr:pur operon repressor [Alkaliphilus metalliredigens]ABR46391.1 purine operon repressor, PurR [Alkaliphilus metalliredigens QYMF]